MRLAVCREAEEYPVARSTTTDGSQAPCVVHAAAAAGAEQQQAAAGSSRWSGGSGRTQRKTGQANRSLE